MGTQIKKEKVGDQEERMTTKLWKVEKKKKKRSRSKNWKEVKEDKKIIVEDKEKGRIGRMCEEK